MRSRWRSSCTSGACFSWNEWATTLSEEIALAQADGDPDTGTTYYHHWLAASIERLVADAGAAPAADLARTRECMAPRRAPHTPRQPDRAAGRRTSRPERSAWAPRRDTGGHPADLLVSPMDPEGLRRDDQIIRRTWMSGSGRAPRERNPSCHAATRALYRDTDDQKLGGVCSGLGGRYFDLDPFARARGVRARRSHSAAPR